VPLIRRLLDSWRRTVAWFDQPIDARVYACVRIAYALTCLVILLRLWPYRLTYLSEQGSLVPAARPFQSPLSYSRSDTVVTGLFVTAIACALALIAGVAKRLAALGLHLWHVSFAAAGYMVMSGYDAVVRMIGFVLLLSPLGPPLWRWRSSEAEPERVPSYGLRLLQFQTCVIYFATVWLKAPDPYWRRGDLMAYFHLSIFARFPTPQVADFPVTSVLMTWSTIVLETALPFLLWNKSTRRWGFFLGALLHGGIALTSTLWVFSLAMLPLYLAFLDESDLDALRLRRSATSLRSQP
jgi:hypothetical protein